MIVSYVFNFIAGDSIVQFVPALWIPATIVEHSFSGYYAWVLLKLSPVSVHYRTAGISALISVVLIFLAEVLDSSGWGIVLMLIAVVPIFITPYQEYLGHSEAVEELDADLAAKWRKQWYWFIRCVCAMVIGLLLAMIGLIPVALFVLLAAIVGVIVLGILRCIYLYRTGKVCREYVERCSQIE